MASHALLSASGAARWMACPPSARLEESLPDTTSNYAAEGTLAHAIGELKLRKHFTEPMGARTYTANLNKLKKQDVYDPEMLAHTDVYLDYVKTITMSYPTAPVVLVEKRLDLSVWVPEGFGTGDCIVIGGDTLHVIDFKYGKGVPVYPEGNPQMMLYALGAWIGFSLIYDIKTVTMHIVQPRLNSMTQHTMPLGDLLAWGENEAKTKAALAYAGEGEFTPGDHCRFCKVGAQCRYRAGSFTALEDFKAVPSALLAPDEIGNILQRADDLVNWYSTVKEYALSECLAGRNIPGWKAVEGRAVRQFADADRAFEILIKNGTAEDMLYERKPLTLAAVEKLIGKKTFTDLLQPQVITPQGKPTLAPESDKRPAFNGAAADFSEVAVI